MLPIIILTVLFTNKAFSFYLDPGTGSYLTQIILASALSLIFYMKHIKDYLKESFHHNRAKHKG
jgi:hypothetical protein